MQDIPIISLWMVPLASKRDKQTVELCFAYCIIDFTERVKVQLWTLLQDAFELLLCCARGKMFGKGIILMLSPCVPCEW